MTCEVKTLGQGSTISGTVGITGSVDARPSGLNVGGKITVFTIDDSSWTKLPPSPLALRNAMSIQNTSGNQIKVNYDSFAALPVGYVGVSINSGNERFYAITSDVNIYAKAAPGSGTITIQVEEIA